MTVQEILAGVRAAGVAGDVVGPGEPGYDLRRRVWNGCADRQPAAIIRAEGVEDVRRVVAIAARMGCPLAVRGGGHSLPGLSTCDGGIVLDLGAMNGVTVDPDRAIARVGGGALLGDLDRAGAPHGLVVPAGVISHTGAGGLTLGGGMGWLSRRYGLTIDHLAEVTLVTAAGEVRTVDADRDPDLFWGLKGGGGNFGVVIEFVFRMKPLDRVETRSWTYPPGMMRSALLALAAAAEAAPDTLTCSAFVTPAGLSLTVLQSGTEIDAGAWDAFANLAGPGADGPRYTDFVAFQSRGDAHVSWGRRYYARGGFLERLDPGTADTITDIATAMPTADSEVYLIQLGGAVARVPEDDAAYSGRAAGWYWIVQPLWDDPAQDAACLAAGRAGAKLMAARSMAVNYVNEQADTDPSIASQAYGATKFRRLQALKRRWDPGNVFRLNQNIPPE